MRKVLVRPDRNGYIYVIDCGTGQVLSATPYVYITTTKGVDLNTGRLVHVDEKSPEVGKEKSGIHGSGLEGLAAVVVFAAYGADVHPAREYVHERAVQRRELHRGDAVYRGYGEVLSRAGREYGRGDGVGSDPWQKGLDD